jgi:hypothetical protein
MPHELRVQVGYTAGVDGTNDVGISEPKLPEGGDVLTVDDD